MSRASRTTSALSYKSARSAFDDEVSSTGDFRSVDGDAQSLDLDRRVSTYIFTNSPMQYTRGCVPAAVFPKAPAIVTATAMRC